MEARGFKNRQWRCVGETNKGTRYEGKLVGDSPEFCRGLDSHGFADLKVAMDYHSCLSCAMYPIGDARRFDTGTPAQVFSTMARCWTVAPTSARVIEDIDAFPAVLDKVIAARGCVVHDEFLRSGRRAVKKNGEAAKLKARSRQTKKTLQACPRHSDVEEARRLFVAQFNKA